MKKTISVILILVLVLALGAVACADTGIVVIKNPTDETRAAGETAWFVSGAQYYETLDWTFVDPTGNEHTVKDFREMFPYVTVEGENTTTLTVRNLCTELNGWAVFCNFHSSVDNARTSWAFFHVNAYTPTYSAPTYTAPTYSTYIPVNAIPDGGSFGGYGYDENGHLEYDVYYSDGSYTTYYYDGSSLTNNLDGSYVYQSNDGSFDFFNNDGYRLEQHPDGSYMEYHADGSWESYDASTNSYNFGADSWGG